MVWVLRVLGLEGRTGACDSGRLAVPEVIAAYEACHGLFSVITDADEDLKGAKRTLRCLKQSLASAALLFWLCAESFDKLKARKGCQGVRKDAGLAAELHPVLVAQARKPSL